MLAATIVEPTGVPAKIEKTMPKTAQKTEITLELSITALKLPNIRIDVRDGNTTSAVINNEPTRFMATTITAAIVTAIIKL